MILTIPVACYICGAETQTACDWVGDKFVRTHVLDIREGDELAKSSRSRHLTEKRPARYFVQKIKVYAGGQLFEFTVTVKFDSGSTKTRKFHAGPTSHALVRRPATCQDAACEAHIRELSDRVHHCKSHWNSWKEAA